MSELFLSSSADIIYAIAWAALTTKLRIALTLSLHVARSPQRGVKGLKRQCFLSQCRSDRKMLRSEPWAAMLRCVNERTRLWAVGAHGESLFRLCLRLYRTRTLACRGVDCVTWLTGMHIRIFGDRDWSSRCWFT